MKSSRHGEDIRRIVDLPISYPISEDEVDAISKMVVQAKFYDDGFRLLHEQANGLLEFMTVGGVLGPIPVGCGKTGLSYLCAEHAWDQGERKIMIFVPSDVFPQFAIRDLPWCRQRFVMKARYILVGNKTKAQREAIMKKNSNGVYLMSYSHLSVKDAEDFLSTIDPTLIIFDEAHNLKNRRAARTRRMLGFMSKKRPAVVAMSGTLTTKSIKDYWHFSTFALRDSSPLPLSVGLADEWASMMDSGVDFGREAEPGPILPLLNWAKERFPDEIWPRDAVGRFRKALNLRVEHCPGVIIPTSKELPMPLVLENLGAAPDEGYAKVEELMTQVEELAISPSGDDIEYGFHTFRHLNELTAGFYYNLRWPNYEEMRRKGAYKKASDQEIDDAIRRSQTQREANNLYHRAQRKWLGRYACKGLDTSGLCAAHMSREGTLPNSGVIIEDKDGTSLMVDVFELWHAQREMKFDQMPELISDPIFLSDYKITPAIANASKWKNGGIVWYEHRAIGRRTADKLKDQGADVIWCPSKGDVKGINEIVLDPANAGKILVASWKAHGTGKNLQYFHDQFALQWPRYADRAEQTLGRMHRTGQDADEVRCMTNQTNQFDHQSMAACLIDTIYYRETLGGRPKLLIADWTSLPPMYSDQLLRAKVFMDVKKLDASQRKAIEEKFGAPTA